MGKGVFITIEGADGAGKSTQVEFLNHWLGQLGLDFVSTREPGGTQLGEALRDILLSSKNSAEKYDLSDETELLMMFAARKQHLDELIVPALARGQWVLCDRFTDASYAYQGGGRGISMDRIAQLENWVQQGLQPDLTILLDVPVLIGLERTKNRGATGDRFEQQQIEFKQAVREVYLERARTFPNRIKLIDATVDIEQVQKQMIECLEGLLQNEEA